MLPTNEGIQIRGEESVIVWGQNKLRIYLLFTKMEKTSVENRLFCIRLYNTLHRSLIEVFCLRIGSRRVGERTTDLTSTLPTSKSSTKPAIPLHDPCPSSIYLHRTRDRRYPSDMDRGFIWRLHLRGLKITVSDSVLKKVSDW